MARNRRKLHARARRAVDGLGLLGRFSVLSLACLILLGFVLAHYVGERIHQRALAASTESAEMITRFGIGPQLVGVDLEHGLSPEAVDSLDQLLHAGYTTYPVEEIMVWSRTGRVVYSNDRGLIGKRLEREPGLDVALHGKPRAVIEQEGTKVIEVYVPLRATGPGAEAPGVFEVHLAYAPVAEAIAADRRRLMVGLGIGLLLVWAALFRIVQGASRRLRNQAAENEHHARHDGLTGLRNRGSFYEAVEEALARGGHAAVMIVDLDRFKEVNDTLGHHSGDLLLKQAGERLEDALREG